MTEVRHPLFARVLAFATANESSQQREQRRELAAGLRGRVIEVGAGAGAQFPAYTVEVSEVLAVEPEPHLREKARVAAAGARRRLCDRALPPGGRPAVRALGAGRAAPPRCGAPALS